MTMPKYPFLPTADIHKKYMHKALKEAQKAYDNNEVPIGALVVNDQGAIIGRGYNLVEHTKQQIAHAEVRAIAQACRTINDWRLDKCWIYVTLEPCAMCLNLILLSRFAGLVFGPSSPLFGFETTQRLVQEHRKDTLQIIKGVCKQESEALLKKFFQEQRLQKIKKNNQVINK